MAVLIAISDINEACCYVHKDLSLSLELAITKKKDLPHTAEVAITENKNLLPLVERKLVSKVLCIWISTHIL